MQVLHVLAVAAPPYPQLLDYGFSQDTLVMPSSAAAYTIAIVYWLELLTESFESCKEFKTAQHG